MRRTLGAAILAGVMLAVAVCAAAPPAGANVEDDVCFVLKHAFDTQNTAYYVSEATWETITVGGEVYALVSCRFLPNPYQIPNYGALCQQDLFRIFPTTGPHYPGPLKPRWIQTYPVPIEDPICP
jgi:hypothetical protein